MSFGTPERIVRNNPRCEYYVLENGNPHYFVKYPPHRNVASHAETPGDDSQGRKLPSLCFASRRKRDWQGTGGQSNLCCQARGRIRPDRLWISSPHSHRK